MLVSPDQIEIRLLYFGPGNGSVEVFKCEKLGFVREIRNDQSKEKRQEIIEEINDLAFEKFRSGEFSFEPSMNQRAAKIIVEMCDTDLIRNCYAGNQFLQEISKKELMCRNLYDDDLHRIGAFGGDSAQKQAIELMLKKFISK